MANIDLTLDGVALSTAVPTALVIDVTRPLVGGRRDVYTAVPGRAGSWKYAEEPGDRVLRFKLSLEATTFALRRAAVVALADWCDIGAVAPLIVSDEPDRYHNAILDKDTDPNEWLRAAHPELAFRCDPYSLAVASSSQAATATGGSDSDTFTPIDALDAEPVIELLAVGGTVTGFTLTLNGDTISYDGPTIPGGTAITISSISDTVTTGVNGDTMLTGAYNPANLVMGLITTGPSGFPLIIPGVNAWSISWTGTATAVWLDIQWRRRSR